MRQNNNENAANRYSYVGHVYNIGEKEVKQNILQELPKEWADLHTNGYIHIHDLDAYGLTYNCLTFDIKKLNIDTLCNESNDVAKIIGLFALIQRIIEDYGNEQSGGMAFANFDNDIDELLSMLNVADNSYNDQIIQACIKQFIIFCNDTHTRMGTTSYYVTLNIGLAKTSRAKCIAKTVIEQFEVAGSKVYKPNIVFKIKNEINFIDDSPNRFLLDKALLCTAKKMIPTYLLCDSECDKDYDPEILSVMGCRTRVVSNIHGKEGAIGRGNIANISINLPRIALDIYDKIQALPPDNKFNEFKILWAQIADIVAEILIHRYKALLNRDLSEFPSNCKYNLWTNDFDTSLEDVFKHGTLSIGFIGLSEAMYILFGSKFYTSEDTYFFALCFVVYMREYCGYLQKATDLNFSLLATSGELISGRFIDIDRKLFPKWEHLFSKGFYTNSFHVEVDSQVSSFLKIVIEGPFHIYCNGGSITYLELGEAPVGNTEGLMEFIEFAISKGVRYLGFNFPKDVCNQCGNEGIFDECPQCKSNDITRIRRVSGYLEILDGFTKGKKAEEKHRKQNK